MNPIRILMLGSQRGDAPDFYRGSGPLSALRPQGIEMVYPHLNINWSVMRDCDLIFIQRPHMREDLACAEMARDLNIPLWVDFDDLLFAVPTDNKAHELFSTEEARVCMAKTTKLASFVTVSTPMLKQMLDGMKLNENVHVVPNALDDSLLHLSRAHRMRKPGNILSVAWRGSDTHQRDLLEYAADIADVIRQKEDTHFHFFGYRPWMITDNLDTEHMANSGKPKRYTYHPPAPLSRFMRNLSDVNPHIMIVPLSDHLFNRCKSNIAWIEATLFGAVTIAPDWPEWRKSGIAHFGEYPEGTVSMHRALTTWVEAEPQKLFDLHAKSWSYIREHLKLSKVNRERYRLIAKAIGRSSNPPEDCV